MKKRKNTNKNKERKEKTHIKNYMNNKKHK